MSLFRPKAENSENHPFSSTSGPFNTSPTGGVPQPPVNPAATAPASIVPASDVQAPTGPPAIAPLDVTQTAPLPTSSLTQAVVQPEGTPYKASGRSAPGGILRLLTATVLGALLVGTVYHFVARFFDLVVIFPIFAGVMAGTFISSAVDKGKVRQARLILVCGLCAGLLVYGTKLFLNSRQYRGEMVAGITEAFESKMGAKVTPAQHALFAQMVEQRLNPWRTFRLYMLAQSENGISIKHNGVGEGISIKGSWYWGLLVAEIGLCAMGAGAFAPSKAESPYCEQTDRWLEEETVLRVHPSQNATLLDKLHARDWRGLLETPVGGTVDDKNQTNVLLFTAPSSPTATVATKSTAKGTRPMAHIHIAPQTAESLRAIRREMVARQTATVAAAPEIAAPGTEM